MAAHTAARRQLMTKRQQLPPRARRDTGGRMPPRAASAQSMAAKSTGTKSAAECHPERGRQGVSSFGHDLRGHILRAGFGQKLRAYLPTICKCVGIICGISCGGIICRQSADNLPTICGGRLRARSAGG